MTNKEVRLSAQERQMQISRILMSRDRILVNEIAEMFSVTMETARKDLFALEKNGVVKRFHGGAVKQNNYLPGAFVINERMEQNTLNKRKVAAKASSLIADGATILIDSGSTTYFLSEAITSKRNMLVITNSLSIVTLMANNSIRTMMIGGEVFKSDMSAVGLWPELCLANINADIAIIGATGLNSPSGPSVENFLESNVKNMMIQHSKYCYVVADSSKCLTSSLVQFANWEDIDGLIVDSGVPESFIEKIGNSTRIIIAD